MPRRGKPQKLATGVYRYKGQIRAVVKVRGITNERQYPIGTDLDEILKWQLKAKSKLFDSAPRTAARGSLARDVTDYLSTLTGRRKRDDKALLQHWMDSPLGGLKRRQITRRQVKAQLVAWEEAGAAASSLNHRLRALRNLYRELDADEDEPNPTDGIRKRREPEPENRARNYDLLEAILAFMPDRGTTTKGQPRGVHSLGKARVRVMLWTGLPPKQIGKLRPSDFDPVAGTLKVAPRQKGAGTKATTLPLIPQGVNALKLFFAVKAQGPFSTSSLHKQWIGAQKKLLAELRRVARQAGADPSTIQLPHVRPYDIRHSFGAEAYRRSRNLLGVRKLLLHARLSTSERYMEGAVDESATAVIQSWNAS